LPGGVYDHDIKQDWAGTSPEAGRTMGVENFTYYTINGGAYNMHIDIRGPFNSIESNVESLDINWDTTAISGVDFSNIEVGSSTSTVDNSFESIEGNYLGEDFTIKSTGTGNIDGLGAPTNFSSNFVVNMENIDLSSTGTAYIRGGVGDTVGGNDYMRFVNVKITMTLEITKYEPTSFTDILSVSGGSFKMNLTRIDKYDIDKNVDVLINSDITGLNRKLDFIAPKGSANNVFTATGQSNTLTMKAFEGGSNLFVIDAGATILNFENFQAYKIDNNVTTGTTGTTELIFYDFKVIEHDRTQSTKNDTVYNLSGTGTSKVFMDAVTDDLNIFYTTGNKMYVGRDVDGYEVEKGTTSSNGLMGVDTSKTEVYVYEFDNVDEITFGSGDDFFDGRTDYIFNSSSELDVIDMGEGYDVYVLQRVPNSGGTQITLSDDTVTVGRYGESLVFKNTEMIIADDRNGANGAAVNLTVNIDNFVGYFKVLTGLMPLFLIVK
jgi:hypothetical protein